MGYPHGHLHICRALSPTSKWKTMTTRTQNSASDPTRASSKMQSIVRDLAGISTRRTVSPTDEQRCYEVPSLDSHSVSDLADISLDIMVTCRLIWISIASAVCSLEKWLVDLLI